MVELLEMKANGRRNLPHPHPRLLDVTVENILETLVRLSVNFSQIIASGFSFSLFVLLDIDCFDLMKGRSKQIRLSRCSIEMCRVRIFCTLTLPYSSLIVP